MYTDDEQKSGLPIKTFILSLILIIIFILLLMWLLPMPKNSNGNGSGNGSSNGNETSNSTIEILANRIFSSNIQDMKNAATSYFTTDKLPTKVGDSVKLTLQEMYDNKLLLPFTDKNGNYCSSEESYVLLTKNEDSYEMKVNLKCDEKEDYTLTTMGCYSYCTSPICEKDEKPTPTPTPEPTPVLTGPNCVLQVMSGSVGNDGLYVGNVVVGFKTKAATAKGATIKSYGLGTSIAGLFNGKDSYTITKDGTTTIYGYVKDSNGKTGICSIVVKKKIPTPTPEQTDPNCSLYVDSGTVGQNGSYIDNVVVRFKTKNVTTTGANITAFGLGTGISPTYNSKESFTITKDGTTTVFGYVKDSNGKTGICSLTVRKKTPSTPTDPNCSLYISKGTVGDNGWYVSDVVVKFKSKNITTDGSYISAYGISTSQTADYNGRESLTINSDGTTTVYGYVKDSNGKTAICSVKVNRDTVKPNCELAVTSGIKKANGSYVSDVVVELVSRIDATSGVSLYGMGEGFIPVYNSLTKYTVKTIGNHTVYGYIKDKAGHVSKCDINVKREQPDEPIVSNPSCSLKVTNGTVGDNGWYKGNVTIGFASKTSTNGATIKSFGIGKTETYAGNTSYIVNEDGTTTVYGYVKDSNGYTATCSITLKKDATRPTCSLTVLEGTYNQNGYYTSDVVVGFASRLDATSGINAYGVGPTTTYAGNTSYRITDVGRHTIHGYVKDNAGNTTICDITVEKRSNLEYQYKKDIANQYSNWTNWTIDTYDPKNPPAFGKYTLIEIEDLGKTQEVDYYKESTGQPFYQYKQVKVGTAQQEYCKGYNYFRDITTVTTTYAIVEGTGWKHTGMVSTTGWPTDSLAVHYEFVGFDWSCTGCESSPKKIWNKYGREVGTATSSHSVTTSKITVECAETEMKTIEIFDTVKVFVDYEIIKTPVYKDVYKYRQRTRTLVKKAYTDYQWSIYNDRNLLDNGYEYTGNTRVVG